jgi:N12 class adenine-specific DNA methylase/predicted RNA methylase
VARGQRRDDGDSVEDEDGGSGLVNTDTGEGARAEEAGAPSVSAPETSLLVSLATEIERKKKELTALVAEEAFGKAAAALSELTGLSEKSALLKRRIQARPAGQTDVDALRGITPKRRSVRNLVEPQIAQTARFEKMLGDELGELSPYELRKKDVRAEETTTVKVVAVDKRDVSDVIGDMKRGILERGEFVNADTGMRISFGASGISGTLAHAIQLAKRDNTFETRLFSLYGMKEIIANAVYLDSRISEPIGSKSPNTLFMHKMYGVFACGDEHFLACLSIEESYKANTVGALENTSNRMYNFKSIKITSMGELGFQSHCALPEDNGGPTDVTTLTIAQLRELVKAFDKNFYENISAPGRPEREAEIEDHRRYGEAVRTLRGKGASPDPLQTSMFDAAPGKAERDATLPEEEAVEAEITISDNFFGQRGDNAAGLREQALLPQEVTISDNSPEDPEDGAAATREAEPHAETEPAQAPLAQGAVLPPAEAPAPPSAPRPSPATANTRAHRLYAQFEEMFPRIVSGECSHMRFGSPGDAYEPLSVERLYGDRYSLMLWYTQEGDLMRDPDFTFALDKENRTLNIQEYQTDGVPSVGTVYERVYDDGGNADEKLLAALEQNLLQVLKNTREQERPLAEYTDRDEDGRERKNILIPAPVGNLSVSDALVPTPAGEPLYADPAADAAEREQPENPPEITYAKNPRERYSDNMDALRELRRLERREREGGELYDKYDTEELSRQRLAGYCGWGGLPQVFDERDSQWQWQREALRELLTEGEYKVARESTLNAHYTPQIIIDAMYTAVRNMGLPRDARILEPSCGTGNFIRRLPAAFGRAQVTGVEIDGVTARIAARLCPNAEIIHSGFEHTELEDNSFDLAIGNVPFGNYRMLDPAHSPHWLIHDAFFRKALDKVAPGGVIAFVTSAGTMDKRDPKAREYIARHAELIGAIRLPNTGLSEAGTEVTADIVFLKKRETPLLAYEELPDWCYVAPNADGLRISSYFADNPLMVLGKMERTAYQDRLTCVPFEGADLQKQLSVAIGSLNAKITVARREKQLRERRGIIEASAGIRNFTFGRHSDGKLYYRMGAEMAEVTGKPGRLRQIERLCELRAETRALLELQKTPIGDAELAVRRKTLNSLYEAYRASYGLLNGDSTASVFGKDSDYPLLGGLERYDKDTQVWQKADIFTRRTVNAVIEVTSAESVEEALQISIDKRGKPDVPYMALLLGKEPKETLAELLHKGLVFADPAGRIPGEPYSGITERAEYLSGNVREKLSRAMDAAGTDGAYERNAEALRRALPEDIRAEEITARMGVPWVDAEDYTAFLRHLSGRGKYSPFEVHYSPVTGEFELTGARRKKDLLHNELNVYGVNEKGGANIFTLYQLAEKILNQRRIVVQREKPDPKDPSRTVTYTDPAPTKLANEKAGKIRDAFAEWLFADAGRRAKYERRYNDLFNCLVGREYDGSSLTFPGMDNGFTLRTHQRNAIARATTGGNTLVGHVVGAGKSAVLFASVMRKKALGLIEKACVVVPKALTEQTANDWRRLYPDARILSVTSEDLSSEARRNLFAARVATGTYDAIVMSREQFEKMPMSRKFRIEYIDRQLDELEDMLRFAKNDAKGKGGPSVKQLELAKKRLKARLEALTNPSGKSKAKDDLLEFEQLGLDYLVVDEAHAYKNGFVATKMTNVAGVTTDPADRAGDMQMKCDWFNEKYGRGHILFATGTPVSNSMTELYIMTRYLRPDLLKQAGIAHFDEWAATFGNVVTGYTETSYGKLKLTTRFSKFANLPEVIRYKGSLKELY